MNGPLGERKEGASPRLTASLLHAYHDRGDTTARQRLVELHLPLVESLARRHGRSEDYEDLFQVGCIGLIQAIDRFKPERGEQLAAFAVPNIAGEISRYLRDRGSIVRLPRDVYELRRPLMRAQAELAASLGRTPTGAELASKLGVPEERVALALEAQAAATPLGLSQSQDEATAAALDDTEQRLFLAEVFRDLDERERRILYLQYIRDMETRDVARELSISERQVQRLSRAALDKLRGGLGEPERRLPQPVPETTMAKMAASGSQVHERYFDEPYHIELVRSSEPDAGWTAHVEELPGCESHGATPDDAARKIERAMEDWVAEALANHREVPPPRSPSTHSGRLMLRMPQSLHAELARMAEREDVSLNQFINSSLASAVGWRRDSGDAPAAEGVAAHAPDGAGAGDLRRALVANFVVLAVVGAVAIALLVIAATQIL